jgi:hypothetical protein
MNENFSSNYRKSLDDFEDYIDLLTYDYIKPVISIFIFASNCICLMIFIKILKHNQQSVNKMYYYFLIKSMCDTFIGIIELFYPFYGIHTLSTSKYYITIFWYVYLHKFMTKVLLLASGLLEIVASFDCAIAIDKSLKWFQKWISFIFINIFIFTFCFVYNLYIILGYGIISLLNNNTESIEYHKDEKDFSQTLTFGILNLINSLLRDVVVVILLFIINLYILIKLKQIKKRKNQLQKIVKVSKLLKTRADRAENRKVKMIYVLCLIYIFGHLPSIIYYTDILTTKSYFRIIFYALTDLVYQISYCTPIVVYYLFNNNFKSILNSWYSFNGNSIEPITL